MRHKMLFAIWFVSLSVLLQLAACAIPQPPADSSLARARIACADLSDSARYSCIEQLAVAEQNPHICRLAGMSIDDMCLQAVYESVDDPLICDDLYLPGARLNCQDYFADPNHRPRLNVISQQDQSLGSDDSAGEAGVLAYVQDGDIWIKNLPDGVAQRITDDGVNEEPRWSPSGRWLAFRKLDSQVWLYSLVENQIRAVENGAPVNSFVWLPVEDRLAALIGSGILHLQVIAPDGDEAGRASLWLLSLQTGASGIVAEQVSLPESTDLARQNVSWHKSYDWLPGAMNPIGE